MNLVHLLILVQDFRQFFQKQLVDLLMRYGLVLADQVQDHISVITIVETPIQGICLAFSPVSVVACAATIRLEVTISVAL